MNFWYFWFKFSWHRTVIKAEFSFFSTLNSVGVSGIGLGTGKYTCTTPLPLLYLHIFNSATPILLYYLDWEVWHQGVAVDKIGYFVNNWYSFPHARSVPIVHYKSENRTPFYRIELCTPSLALVLDDLWKHKLCQI